MKTEKQKQITTIMKKSTNNYERPEVQVVYVETEAGFASEGIPNFKDNDVVEESDQWI